MEEPTSNLNQTHSKLVPAVVASVLIGALAAGGGVYAYQKSQSDKSEKDLQDQVATLQSEASITKTAPPTATPTAIATPIPTPATAANLVKYSFASPATTVQFELPDGYGAAKDQEGEGVSIATFFIGKDLPDSGKNVMSATISVATYVKIIPTYDPSMVTIEDWRSKSTISSVKIDSGYTKLSDVTVAGIKAERYTIAGMGEKHVIQFVKDKSFYEIGNEAGSDEEAVAKIVATLSIK